MRWKEAYKCGRLSEHSSCKGGAIAAMELEAVRKLVQERGSDLAFVVNHSGGKDSTRMLGLVRNKFRDSPTYVVMADTGFEHQRPISAADFGRQRCAEFGLNLTVVRKPKRTTLKWWSAAACSRLPSSANARPI